MLFHADRNVKENMFQFLKREAEDHLAKKNENKNLKRNEERMRIESIMQKEREEQERKRMQKIKHMNDMMSEYNNMISKKGEDRSLRKNKFEDIKINSYGVSSNKNNNEMREFENIPNNINSNAFVVPNDLNSQVEYMNSHLNNTGSNNILFNYLIGFNIKADTHINPITHKNINNYDEFVRNKKYEQQKTYKEVLDSQVNQRDIQGFNKSHPHLTRKSPTKYTLSVNPYTNKQYEIGENSLLQRNPIINPINNLEYNRYINLGNISNNYNNPNPSSLLINSNSNNLNNYNTKNNTPLNRNNNFSSLNQNINKITTPDYNTHNINHNNSNNYGAAVGNNNYQYNPVNLNMNQPPLMNNNYNSNRTPMNGDRLRMAATNILG